MLRSSAALQNLADLADELPPSRAALVLTGSVALDTKAKSDIKQIFAAAAIASSLTIEEEKLHPAGLGDELAALLQQTRCGQKTSQSAREWLKLDRKQWSTLAHSSSNAPSWALLLSCERSDAAQVRLSRSLAICLACRTDT